MNKDNFEYHPASVLDELYEEPEELNIFSFDDFLNLPLNDLYIKENGDDAKDFSKYKTKVPAEKIVKFEELQEPKPFGYKWTLTDLVDNSKTDKLTDHYYLDLYEKLLCNKKETAKNVLEIGIDRGGSIKLWSDYFINATVYGIDTMHINSVWDEIIKDKIILYTLTNAYDEEFVKGQFFDKNIKFDFLLDDGPHNIECMQEFIRLYSQIMADDGILIIEDVQDWSWIETLTNAVPEHLKEFVKVYDLRFYRNQYDNIVFTIDKNKNLSEYICKE